MSQSFRFLLLVALLHYGPYSEASSRGRKCAQSGDEYSATLVRPGRTLPETSYLTLGRAANAKAMKNAGNNALGRLVELYKELIPEGGVVLEIGPFYNLLSSRFNLLKHHLEVWELDSRAAEKIAARFAHFASVFQVDLNKLNSIGWNRFMKLRRRILRTVNGQLQSKKFDAVVVSSVFNYVDFKTVLKNIVPLIRENGVLFIANSHAGKGKFYEDRAMPVSMKIIEFLLSEFPGVFDILPGAEMHSDYNNAFSKRPANISIALKVRKNQRTHTRNLYKQIVSVFLDGYNSPTWSINPVPRSRHRSSLQTSNLPYLATPARVRAWQREKEEATRQFHEETKQLIEEVRTAVFGSSRHQEIKDLLLSVEHSYRLTIERRILLEALKIKELEERREFLDKKLKNLYRSLGHESKPIHAQPNTWTADFVRHPKLLRKIFGFVPAFLSGSGSAIFYPDGGGLLVRSTIGLPYVPDIHTPGSRALKYFDLVIDQTAGETKVTLSSILSDAGVAKKALPVSQSLHGELRTFLSEYTESDLDGATVRTHEITLSGKRLTRFMRAFGRYLRTRGAESSSKDFILDDL